MFLLLSSLSQVLLFLPIVSNKNIWWLQPPKRAAYSGGSDRVFAPVDRELVFDVVSTLLTLHIVYYQFIHSYKPDCSILLLLVALKHTMKIEVKWLVSLVLKEWFVHQLRGWMAICTWLSPLLCGPNSWITWPVFSGIHRIWQTMMMFALAAVGQIYAWSAGL